MDGYEQDRLKKTQAIRDLGLDPYGGTTQISTVAHFYNVAAEISATARRAPDDATAETGPEEAGWGRIVLRREMGNLHFLTIRDESGDVQVALSKKALPETDWKLAKLLDLGDIISFRGRCAKTKVGEPTLWATKLGIVSKCTVPPPAKHEGLQDVELRYRQRYVDLWSNPVEADKLRARSEIVQAIRETLYESGFTEVETPILQTIAGGAAAQPFMTHHDALDIPMYLRIAPELFLKRLLVGGVSKVFEIGRNFRNEGISTKHNPEFTVLELYEAMSDFEQMMLMVEHICWRANVLEKDINFNFRRVRMDKLVDEWTLTQSGATMHARTPQSYHELYEKYVEHTLIEPTFVTHPPASAVPLAKHDGNGYALAFEFVANGMEIGCGYTEQNDPAVQEAVFKAQLKAAITKLGPQDGSDLNAVVGEMDAHKIDYDFIQALKVGMPPAGGLGIGIDRLAMWLTGATSARDVILFPTMKPL